MLPRTLTLFVPAALVAAGFAVTSDLPKDEVQRLEKVLMKRLSDANTDKFGVNRIGEPYRSHVYAPRLLRPETTEESDLIKALKAKGWNAVVYTIGAKNSRRPRGFGMVVNGPAFITERDEELPTAGDADPFIDKVRAMRDAKNPDFVYRGWQFTRKDVHAVSSCVSCHVDAKGKPVKVGDVIGHLAIGFKKK